MISFLAFSAPGSVSCWLPPVVMFKPARWGEGKRAPLCQPRQVLGSSGTRLLLCFSFLFGFIFMADSGGFLKVAPASSLSSWLCQKTALRGLIPPKYSPARGESFLSPSQILDVLDFPPTLLTVVLENAIYIIFLYIDLYNARTTKYPNTWVLMG